MTSVRLPTDLPSSSERQGMVRAYHRREEPRATARGVAASADIRADRVAFGCCNGRLGSATDVGMIRRLFRSDADR
jgi:hypothetical protein